MIGIGGRWFRWAVSNADARRHSPDVATGDVDSSDSVDSDHAQRAMGHGRWTVEHGTVNWRNDGGNQTMWAMWHSPKS